MSALLIIAVYVAGWIVAASTGMRALADRMPRCVSSYYCHDFFGHWRGNGEIGQREVVIGSLAAVFWPVLWLPAAAYLLANRRPTPRALENHIASLEREAGIR